MEPTLSPDQRIEQARQRMGTALRCRGLLDTLHKRFGLPVTVFTLPA